MIFPIEQHRIKTVVVVDSNDLDRFISDYYGQEFECIPDQEWGNDSCHLFLVEKRELDTYDLNKLEKFKTGQYCGWVLSTLLDDLCNRDIIPPCNLLVKVCW